MSGYSDIKIPIDESIIEIIKKPFEIQHLVDVIEKWWKRKK